MVGFGSIATLGSAPAGFWESVATELGSIASFGTALLALALVLTVYSGAAAVVGARRPSARLVRSGESALYAVAGLLTVASGLMIYAFVSHDYSIKYVQHYSDGAMPLAYLVTAYWGGLDGSLLFWAFLLGVFGALAVRLNRERHREMLPFIIAVLQGVMTFFLLLLLFERNPFGTFIPGAAVPADGRGLNPLLQNSYMVTHPPALYLGFVGMTIPYAFGMAALISGRLDEAWLLSIRRWVLVSWFFLTTGLVLGMLWAYEELGWGGVWAWDAVENAGLYPWLTATALLHSIMIQERRGMLKQWNVTLVIVTFFLTVVGTFQTRSGVTQSVHAFGQDTRLAVIFGTFMLVILGFSFSLVARRQALLRSRHQLDSLLSREVAFLANNWVLLFAALFLVGATFWPTFTELLTGERVTMGAPFFNRWMAPIGLILLVLTGLCPLIPWRRASPRALLRQFLWPSVGGLVVLASVVAWDIGHGVAPLARLRSVGLIPLCVFVFAGFTLTTIGQELWRGAGVRARSLGIDRLTALVGLVARGKRRYGGYLVHAGIVFVLIGLAGGAFKDDLEVSMRTGQSVEFAGYGFTLADVTSGTDGQKRMVTAHVTVTEHGRPVRRLRPSRWIYFKNEEQPTTEVDIWRQAGKDVYLIMADYDLTAKPPQAMLKIVVNPLMNWLWFGYVLLALGTAVAIAPDRVFARVRAARGEESGPPSGRGQAKNGAAAAVVLALVLAASGGLAHAQPATAPAPFDHSTKARIIARSPAEQRLFRRLVCMCATCPRLPLSECGCGYAEQERQRISRMLNVEHRTEEQVVAAFVAQYGQAVLGAPVAGVAGYSWLILYGMGGLAIVGLVLAARRWTRARGSEDEEAPEAGAAAAGPPPAQDAGRDDRRDTYEQRLDDELRDLD